MTAPTIDRTAYNAKAHALPNLLAIADEASPAAWASPAEITIAADCVVAADEWLARVCETVKKDSPA